MTRSCPPRPSTSWPNSWAPSPPASNRCWRAALLAETAGVREADWTVAPQPKDLQNRRVEITGPVDRKMIINGLNSGASVFMADFEDSCAPTWENVIEGQIHLRDAVRGTIRFLQPETGKVYKLLPRTATL